MRGNEKYLRLELLSLNFDDPKPFYRQRYYKPLDVVLKEKFDQPGYKMYKENLGILKLD